MVVAVRQWRWVAVACALAFSSQGCGEDTPSKPDALGWVSVQDGRLVDEAGRELILRGMNARIEGVFDVVFADGRERLEPIPLFGQEDADTMASLGFNYLRLPINWSGLEPEEGQFDMDYLRRVDEVVEHCRNAGLYVLIDFHQDAYSKEIGEDGAPYWAIYPPAEFTLEGPLEDLAERRASAQVLEAFEAFFDNTEGLMDRFLPAVEMVVARYAGDSAVIGFEIMNEPVAFHVSDGINKLFGFYEKVTETIRGIDSRHTIWMEPDSSRNLLLVADAPRSFPDDNIVYTPHMYPGFSDSEDWGVDEWVEELTFTYEQMVKEKRSWGGALVLGEWGANPRYESSIPYIRASRQIFNQHLMGETFWLWKENCQDDWGLFAYNELDDSWSLDELAAKELGTPTIHAAPGTFESLTFDPSTSELTATLNVSSSGWAQLYLPTRWYSEVPVVTLNGAPLAVTPLEHDRYEALLPAGTRTLVVTPATP